jgi:integrase
MKAVITGCGFELVGDIGTEAIARYLERLIEAGKSARTHNFHRSAAGALCRWLVDYDYLDRNHASPIRTMNEQKDSRRPSRHLTVAETEALLDAAPPRRLYYLFRLRTGLRGRECARLIWSDVDLRERTLKLRAQVTKNGCTDMLPIAEDLAQALAQRQAEMLQCGTAPGPNDPVFPTTPERRTWMRDIDLAKIKFLSTDGQADPKCLRKTFDSFLMHAGVDLTLVSLLMRHTPRGGLRLTLGVYGDERALLQKKRQAIAQMVSWYRQQKRQLKATG